MLSASTLAWQSIVPGPRGLPPPVERRFLWSPGARQLRKGQPGLQATHRHPPLPALRVLASLPASSPPPDDARGVSPPGSIPSRRVSVPDTVEESVDQATSAVRRAVADGHRLLLLELLLPLIGPSLLDDWPGGIRQQLEAATPLIMTLLAGIADRDGRAGPLDFSGEMRFLSDEDCVVLWESDKVVLVLFPTADTLPALRQLSAANERPLLIVNPQWQPGQVVSDFGFGNRRRDAEEFLGSFLTAYSLKRLRVRGADVTVVRCYPSDWCVFTGEAGSGVTALAGTEVEKPEYRRLEALVKAASAPEEPGLGGWVSRLSKEIKFLKDSK